MFVFQQSSIKKIFSNINCSKKAMMKIGKQIRKQQRRCLTFYIYRLTLIIASSNTTRTVNLKSYAEYQHSILIQYKRYHICTSIATQLIYASVNKQTVPDGLTGAKPYAKPLRQVFSLILSTRDVILDLHRILVKLYVQYIVICNPNIIRI